MWTGRLEDAMAQPLLMPVGATFGLET